MPAVRSGHPRTSIALPALRDSLTVLAILLIGVLTTALVGPYFIDWDAHRALIERKLSQAVGVPVTVSGTIDLKLLPKPIFRFGRAVVGDGVAGRPRLSVEALDAEVSLTGLMRGQVQVVDTTLVRPRLDLVEAPDGGFGLPPLSDEAADRVAVDHLGVRDGTVALRRADGKVQTLANLDFDGEATSLRGPFKATGRVAGLPFRVATGALDGGRLRAKLHVDATGGGPSLDLDGVVAPRPGGRGFGFDGSAAAAGRIALDGTPAVVPWRLTARLSADRSAATASDVEVRAGADLRALIANGHATAAYEADGAPPRATVQLAGATLDVDGLAVAPENSSVAPPKGFDLLRRLVNVGGRGPGLPSPPLLVDVALKVDTATLAGQTVLGSSADVQLGPKPGAGLRFGVDGPAGTRITFDGRFDPGFDPPVAGPFGAAPIAVAASLRGRAEARSNDVTRTAAWLAPAAPGFAAWLAATVPGRTLAASGSVVASNTEVRARDLALRVDGSRFTGTASLASAVGTERPRLFADLSSDALALDRLPNLSGAAAASRDLDFDLALSARTVTVEDPAAAVAPPGFGPIAAGHVALHLTKVGTALKLDRLALDVAGAKLDATASGTEGGQTAELRVSAPHLGPLVEAVAPVLPPSVAGLLRDRAAALSPVAASLTLAAEAGRDGIPALTSLALAGTAGSTRVDAAVAPDGPANGRDAANRPVAVSLRADAPDMVDLLRQFGLPAGGSGLGPGHLDATAKGSVAAGFAVTLAATLPGTSLSYNGTARPAAGDGHVALRAADFGPLFAALGSAPGGPPVPGDIAADVAWDGTAARLAQIAARVAGTEAAGDLAFTFAPSRPGETGPKLRGQLSLDRLAAPTLLGLALGPPQATPQGAAWSDRPFAPPTLALPRSEIGLTVADLSLRPDLAARDVALTLRSGGGAITLADMSGRIAAGRFSGDIALRRDASGAAMSGHLAWSDIGLGGGALSARVGGREELAGTGGSPAALVANLAGSGRLAVSRAALAQTDPLAPARTLAHIDDRRRKAELGSADTEVVLPEADAVGRELAAELDRGPLPIGDADVATTLTGGVLRSGPITSSGVASPAAGGPGNADAPRWSAKTDLSLDLGALALTVRSTLRGGAATSDGEVVVSRTGPFGADAPRTVEASGLLQAVQARAIARAQDRIDVLEQDIRERAAFNRQLKAIQADQQVARNRAEADRRAAIARAAIDAQAKAAEAEKAAADARRTEAAQKVEDARVQAQIEAAARADAAAKDEAEKQRFIERALRSPIAPLDRGGRNPPLLGGPPKIIQEDGTR